jgi:hypothetical protein
MKKNKRVTGRGKGGGRTDREEEGLGWKIKGPIQARELREEKAQKKSSSAPIVQEEWTAEQIETLIIKLTSTATLPSRSGFIDWTLGSFHRSLVNAIAEVLYEVTKERKP